MNEKRHIEEEGVQKRELGGGRVQRGLWELTFVKDRVNKREEIGSAMGTKKKKSVCKGIV